LECFEYTVAPPSTTTRYHDHFDAVFPMLLHYLLFH